MCTVQAKVVTGTGPAAAVTGDAAAQEARLVHFEGSFKLAAEPRGVPRSAALAAAEAVLVSLCCCQAPTTVRNATLAICFCLLFPY